MDWAISLIMLEMTGNGAGADLDHCAGADTDNANVLVQLAAAECAKSKDDLTAATAFFEHAILRSPRKWPA